MSWLVVAALVLTSCARTPTGEQEEEEEEGVEIPTLSIGETYTPTGVAVGVRGGQLEVTVSDIIIADSFEYYDNVLEKTVVNEAKPERCYLTFTASFKNVSNMLASNVGRWRFRVIDDQGRDFMRELYFADDILHDRYTAPDATESGKVVYKIWKDSTGLRVRLVDDAESGLTLAYWEVE